MDIPTDTMDTDTMEEKEDQQRLKQKPLLTPRLTLTCCMEDIMDMDMDLDTMGILMVDTTGENKQPKQQRNAKRYCKPRSIKCYKLIINDDLRNLTGHVSALSLPEYKLGNISCSARVHPH